MEVVERAADTGSPDEKQGLLSAVYLAEKERLSLSKGCTANLLVVFLYLLLGRGAVPQHDPKEGAAPQHPRRQLETFRVQNELFPG